MEDVEHQLTPADEQRTVTLAQRLHTLEWGAGRRDDRLGEELLDRRGDLGGVAVERHRLIGCEHFGKMLGASGRQGQDGTIE